MPLERHAQLRVGAQDVRHLAQYRLRISTDNRAVEIEVDFPHNGFRPRECGEQQHRHSRQPQPATVLHDALLDVW
jgi:hypothetical protein